MDCFRVREIAAAEFCSLFFQMCLYKGYLLRVGGVFCDDPLQSSIGLVCEDMRRLFQIKRHYLPAPLCNDPLMIMLHGSVPVTVHCLPGTTFSPGDRRNSKYQTNHHRHYDRHTRFSRFLFHFVHPIVIVFSRNVLTIDLNSKRKARANLSRLFKKGRKIF